MHSTAGKGIGRGLQREVTRRQQSTPILGVSAVRVDALAGVLCDQRDVRVQQYSAALAQSLSQMAAAFRPLPHNAMLGPGVTPDNQEPTQVIQHSRNGEPYPIITHCRLGATAVTAPSDKFPFLASPAESQKASGDRPSAHLAGCTPACVQWQCCAPCMQGTV